jgi:uncharacterized protein
MSSPAKSSPPRHRHEFHEGERSVQERAGVRAQARALAKIVLPHVPAAAAGFLSSLPFVVVGSSDDDGAVWASILTGDPGFLRLEDGTTLEGSATFAVGDPLERSFDRPRPLGILAIELATRSRVRLNGDGALARGKLAVSVREFYGNCPQYIHSRDVVASVSGSPVGVTETRELTTEQIEAISRADTFFIASRHPTRGADASHRGGEPGFVRVLDRSTLVFPDYPGNNMFNTLGNLAADPRAGLLFVDFARGRTLQLTGGADIVWGPGGHRAVGFEVRKVVENPAGTSLRWSPPS